MYFLLLLVVVPQILLLTHLPVLVKMYLFKSHILNIQFSFVGTSAMIYQALMSETGNMVTKQLPTGKAVRALKALRTPVLGSKKRK